ncbi:TPA: hypothetical protein ACGOR8_001957 [Streptococcus suis]
MVTTDETNNVVTIKLSELESELRAYLEYMDEDSEYGQMAHSIIDNMVVGMSLFFIGDELAIPVYGGSRQIKYIFGKAGLDKEQIDKLFVIYYRILYFELLRLGQPDMRKMDYYAACVKYVRSLTYKQYQNLLKVPVNELAPYLMNVQFLSKLFSDEMQRLPLWEVEHRLKVSFNTKEKVAGFIKDTNGEFIQGKYIDKDTGKQLRFILD